MFFCSSLREIYSSFYVTVSFFPLPSFVSSIPTDRTSYSFFIILCGIASCILISSRIGKIVGGERREQYRRKSKLENIGHKRESLFRKLFHLTETIEQSQCQSSMTHYGRRICRKVNESLTPGSISWNIFRTRNAGTGDVNNAVIPFPLFLY